MVDKTKIKRTVVKSRQKEKGRMTEKIKTNQGETDVKSEDTILHTPNMIDFSNTKITRGKNGDWDNFQIYGGESNYQSSTEEIDKKLMTRIRNRSIGRKIRQLNLDIA